MARPPDRRRDVFFLGAGFSSTAGLPNTAALLDAVHRLALENRSWGVSQNLQERLNDAYFYFYPEEGAGFRPDVVDFFSVLSAYVQVDRTGLPDGFSDRQLLPDLKFAIAHALCSELRDITEDALREPHLLLDRMLRPGNVVITTNWDTLVERAAAARTVRYRLSGSPVDSELLILKLHGSIDWLEPAEARRPVGNVAYADLTELCASTRARRSAPTTASTILRTRINHLGASWRTIKSATSEPFMVTMSPGKADALGPVLGLWEDAYRAVSSAASLEIIGYSMPRDDIEIRTILRAGVLRGPTNPEIRVWNPAPDVHGRIRGLIFREVQSDYTAVPAIA